MESDSSGDEDASAHSSSSGGGGRWMRKIPSSWPAIVVLGPTNLFALSSLSIVGKSAQNPTKFFRNPLWKLSCFKYLCSPKF